MSDSSFEWNGGSPAIPDGTDKRVVLWFLGAIVLALLSVLAVVFAALLGSPLWAGYVFVVLFVAAPYYVGAVVFDSFYPQ